MTLCLPDCSGYVGFRVRYQDSIKAVPGGSLTARQLVEHSLIAANFLRWSRMLLANMASVEARSPTPSQIVRPPNSQFQTARYPSRMTAKPRCSCRLSSQMTVEGPHGLVDREIGQVFVGTGRMSDWTVPAMKRLIGRLHAKRGILCMKGP